MRYANQQRSVRRVRLLWLGAAFVCFVALSAMLLVNHLQVRSDLRVTLPSAAVAGGRLPLRALLYQGLDAVSGPELSVVPGRARLCDPRGSCGPFVSLRPGLGPSLEGSLSVPAGAKDAVVVQLELRPRAGQVLSLRAVVRVAGGGEAAPLPQARPLRRLQQLALGPLRRAVAGNRMGAGFGDSIALPSSGDLPELQVVVGGGVCVPEQPCELFAIAAGDANEISFQATNSVTLEERVSNFAGSPALLQQRVVVHGPEGNLGVQAVRFAVVDSRRVRLPVALGSGTVRRGPRLLVAGQALRLRLDAVERGPCIVDRFVAGRWTDTATVPRCQDEFLVPFKLSPGIERLQLRRDPFSTKGAAVRVVAVVPLGATVEAALPALLAAAGPRLQARLGAAPWQKGDLQRLPPSHARLLGELLVAQLEDGLISLPEPLSDHVQAHAELARRKRWLRIMALSSIALSALAIVLLMGRSSAWGGAQVDALLSAAGSERAVRVRARQRRRWALLLVLVSLGLAFLSMGLYVVVRTR